eukprot:TRINITY_DN5362_c0_g2_i1.p1 TRINITY_DN5362_c0_g2~~TRINITY_DN5362_c0_g2_i1.p1  ORF type:complete len:1067 (-),score=251.23 TRINITY_DN5362_c0_g2_i1:70-3270(-)
MYGGIYDVKPSRRQASSSDQWYQDYLMDLSAERLEEQLSFLESNFFEIQINWFENESWDNCAVVTVLPSVTLSTLKNAFKAHMEEENLSEDWGAMTSYQFRIPGAGFLNNESQKVQDVPYLLQFLQNNRPRPILLIYKKNSQEASRVKKQNLHTGNLIGRPLSWRVDDGELTHFRQNFAIIRREELLQKDDGSKTRGIRVNVTEAPLELNGPTFIKLRVEGIAANFKTVSVEYGETADEFINNIFERFLKRLHPNRTFEDYVLKVTGLVDYIVGPYYVHHFDHIREYTTGNTQRDIILTMMEIKDVPDSSRIHFNEENNEELMEFVPLDNTLVYDHEDLNYDVNENINNISKLSVWNVNKVFRLRIIGAMNVTPPKKSKKKYDAFFVTVGLYHGSELLDIEYKTDPVLCDPNPKWFEYVNTVISINNLPRETKVNAKVWYQANKKREPICIGWTNLMLFDFKHEMAQGVVTRNLWDCYIPESKIGDSATAGPLDTVAQPYDNDCSNIFLEFEEFARPVVFPTGPFPPREFEEPSPLTGDVARLINSIVRADPLHQMEPHEKPVIWRYRNTIKNKPPALPKFILSVPKTDRHSIQEMHKMLEEWAPPTPYRVIELLDGNFADTKVREYAVEKISELSTENLMDILLQLVQVLKYEPYHDSALARFLIKRSINNQTIAHHFFWCLKSEMHSQSIEERFGLMLEAYLRGAPSHAAGLKRQEVIQNQFIRMAQEVKSMNDRRMKTPAVLQELATMMRQVHFDEPLLLPLDPRIEVSSIRVEKCKFMDSKMAPLWVVFENNDPDGPPPITIFKSGDDLRQDMLTLQMIRLMDKFWKREGYDFKMNPYECISTGDGVGMIEVVQNADTCANITAAGRGMSKTANAFSNAPIKEWLMMENPGKFEIAVENFIDSCAGYCIATYVIGIGDRHNDNVMIKKNGCLFHIDFGHFLGNYKSKMGFKREENTFVFTPDFAFVMGGRDSELFVRFREKLQIAYRIIRNNMYLFILLFSMMIPSGMPELADRTSLEYLRESLCVGQSDIEANDHLDKLLDKAISSKRQMLNNAVHIWVHK